LFKTIEEYDSRFLIVHDRYEFPGGVPRSLEVRLHLDRINALHVLTRTKDLKDRYYSVCRKLVRNRPWNGDELSKNKVLVLLSFEKGIGIIAPATVLPGNLT